MNHKEEIRESHNIHVKVTCGKGKSACFILSLGLNLRGRNPHKYIYLKTKQNKTPWCFWKMLKELTRYFKNWHKNQAFIQQLLYELSSR